MNIQHERLPVSMDIVDHTDFTRNIRVIIDWLSVTFKFRTDLSFVYDLLAMDESDFQDQRGGMEGYKKQKRNGHIIILYDGTPEMGIHVSISGQGCREYEQHVILKQKFKSMLIWKDIICDFLGNGGNITRLDLAIDDFTPYFEVRDLWKRLKTGQVTSKMKQARCMEGIDIATGEETGFTIYIGSDHSNVQLCIYAKDLERESKGKELEEGVTAWNRIELRLYDERCYSAAVHILQSNDLGTVANGILHNYISFLERNQNDMNKNRWKLWRNWSKFLGAVDKLPLTHIAPDRTVERSITWIDHQVKKTLGKIYLADDGDMSRIKEWVLQGVDECTNDLDTMAQVHRYQKSKELMQALNEMTPEQYEKAINYLLKEKDAGKESDAE